jgi:glycosyltransferase involved in cell wall biosynthesis
LKIFFLFADSFPASTAYSNRIHSLALGLLKMQNDVEVSIVYPGSVKRRINEIPKNGFYQGVSYKHYCFFIDKPKSFLFQKIIGVLGIINFIRCICLERLKNKIDFVILCSSNLWHIIPMWIFAHLLGFKILREKNEYPKFVIQNQNYFAKSSRYHLLDGFIFMTHTLEDFFVNKLGFKGKYIVIPMTVDFSRFSNNFNYLSESNVKYITLVGDVLGEKDGVLLLMESFALISSKYPEIIFRLIGEIYSQDKYYKLLQRIADLQISHRVEFTGLIKRDDIPNELQKSHILVLPRPISLQSESGFPTKLGEYLASGKPVIVTKTGEIEKYLKDEVDAYIIEPNRPDLFAKAIEKVLLDYDYAIKVGKTGQLKAKEVFSLEFQANRLNSFLKNFN